MAGAPSREAQGRPEVLLRRLFEDFDAAGDVETRCNVSDRIVRIAQRLSQLLGLDGPQRFAIGLYPETTVGDDATVAEMRGRLTVEELEQLQALGAKARGRMIATTATVVQARPPAPMFDDEPDGKVLQK